MATNSLILWGRNSDGTYHYENRLLFGRPGYNMVTDRVPRPPSQSGQGPSGVEDAFIVGRDFVLWITNKWIPDGSSDATMSPLSGPVGWQAFFDYARDKNPFRFVPDATYPGFYVDGCYLVDPIGKGSLGQLDDVILRDIPYQIRNPSLDFHQALRGIMMEYAPGANITDPVAYTFSRADGATCATQFNASNTLITVAANVLRERQNALGLHATLIERAATNGILRSTAFDNASWTKTRCSVSANAVTGLDGTAAGDKLVEDASASTTHFISQATPTLTDNTLQCWYVIARKAERSWIALELLDKSGTTRNAYFDLTNGVVGGGNSLGIIRAIILPDGNTAYLCALIATAASGATTPIARCYLATGNGTASYTGDGASGVYLYHAQFEADKAFPTSPIITTSASVTRAADSFTRPLSDFMAAPISDFTIYLSLIRPMWADATATDLGLYPGLLQIGTYPAGVRIYGDQTTRTIKADINGGAVASQNIPAGNLTISVQCKTVTTAAQIAIDVGSGLSAFTASAGALTSWGASSLVLGGGAGVASAEIVDVRIAPGLRSLGAMQIL